MSRRRLQLARSAENGQNELGSTKILSMEETRRKREVRPGDIAAPPHNPPP